MLADIVRDLNPSLTSEQKYALAIHCLEVFADIPEVVTYMTELRDNNLPTP